MEEQKNQNNHPENGFDGGVREVFAIWAGPRIDLKDVPAWISFTQQNTVFKTIISGAGGQAPRAKFGKGLAVIIFVAIFNDASFRQKRSAFIPSVRDRWTHDGAQFLPVCLAETAPLPHSISQVRPDPDTIASPQHLPSSPGRNPILLTPSICGLVSRVPTSGINVTYVAGVSFVEQ